MAAPGDRIPEVDVRVMSEEGTPSVVNTTDVLGRGKVILFAVPGAFTPGCSKTHLPGYVANADELKAKGVDTIACIAVNDIWVMDAWGREKGADGKITMIADGSGEFTKAMDLVLDATAGGMGLRSKRYAAVIEDGVITNLDVDESGKIEVSTCEAVIDRI
jgi:peroxiredoxin